MAVEVMLTMCSPLRDERRPTTEHTAATSPASPQYRHSWLARRRRRSPAVSHAPPICMGSSSGRTRRWDRVSQVVTDSTPMTHSRGNPENGILLPGTESNPVIDPDGEVNQFIQANWKLQRTDLVLHVFSQSVEEVIPERILVPATGYGERVELNQASGHGLFALQKHRQGSCRLNSPGRTIKDLAQLLRECLKRLTAGLLTIPHGCAPLPRLPHQERDDIRYPG